MIESLEDRMVLSTVFVVPIAQALDATHRHSLTDALSLAVMGDTVIIEPGVAPELSTVNVTVANVTIAGDLTVSAGSLGRYDLNINADQVTLTNLNLGTVTLSDTSDHATISRSQLINFTETGAASGVGHNTLSHNLIMGSIDLQGNSGLFQTTADMVADNSFVGSAPATVKLTNSNLTTVQNNHILSDAASGIGIQVRSNSDQVAIAGNTVEMTGAGLPIAVMLVNTGGAAGNIIGAKVLNNKLSTGGNGTGLYINIFGTGSAMVAQVEGSEINQNKAGVDINGVPGGTGAGNIDLGGGSNAFGTSKGANNFRGFDGVAGHFAINLHNTDAGITVSAHQNLFDNGATLSLVVRDQNNGGGTGVINTTNPLDANHAYVQSMFSKLLGRAGDPTVGGEIDQWAAKLPKIGKRGVARGILLSDESLGRIVNDVFAEFLDRAANATEVTKYSKQLKAGVSLTSVQAAVLSSVEYQSRINTDFVQSLYLNVLHRPATTDELTKNYALLRFVGLRGLAAKVTGSKERRAEIVMGLYHDLLHRSPTADEATALAKKPGTPLALELLVLSSDEYFNHG